MEIRNNKQDISFKHIYAIKGNKVEILAAKKIIESEARTYRIPFETKTIQQSRDTVTIGVATGQESLRRFGSNDFVALALKQIIDAKEMVNPFRTIKFLCSRGQCIKKVEFKFDKKEIISDTWFDNEKNKSPNEINIIRFDKPKPILEALRELAEMPNHLKNDGKDYIFNKENIFNLLEYEDDIGDCPDLKKINVKGLCGQGAYSTVFELPNGYCLKLGFLPNAPLKDEIYDIPTILKRKVRMKYPLSDVEGTKKHIYYTVQKKGLSKNEYYITPKHLKEVENEIEKTHIYPDIQDCSEKQIAIYNGKPYLVDAAVVANRELYA